MLKNVGEKSTRARREFGLELKRMQKQSGLSHFDIAYALDINQGTLFSWMTGDHFPQSIFMLKKLHFLFSDSHDIIVDILGRRRIALSDGEWAKFQKKINCGNKIYTCKDDVSGYPGYKHTYLCDDQYRYFFGQYLRKSRIEHGITIQNLSDAIGVKTGRYFRWEKGVSFPRDIFLVGYFDRLYGNAFNIVFGICPEYGLDLSKEEKKKITCRVRECRKSSSHNKSIGWLTHHQSFLNAQDRYFGRVCGNHTKSYNEHDDTKNRLEILRYFLEKE